MYENILVLERNRTVAVAVRKGRILQIILSHQKIRLVRVVRINELQTLSAMHLPTY